jgi:hypothetical protein
MVRFFMTTKPPNTGQQGMALDQYAFGVPHHCAVLWI